MKVLVTGGGGFLGSAITRVLHARGDEVLVLGRHDYPHHREAGVSTLVADLRDPDAVNSACRGVETVFHTGALAGIWGKRRDYWDTNVGGTTHVIDACRAHGVSKLVYTSSPSVVFGKAGLSGVDESQPYPSRYLAHYPRTKAIAERMVLEANSSKLSTVSLRPHLIWGPGDPHLIPRVLERARRGRLVQVGNGKNLVDITYIDNAADAHICAADKLAPDARCAGQAYFISQGEPVQLWSWINDILGSLSIPSVNRSISYRVARITGALMELVYASLHLRGEPPMTRFLASQLAKDHYFSIERARTDFGYVPRVSTKIGMRRLIDSLSSAA